MSDATCSEPQCRRSATVKGLCPTHYSYMRHARMTAICVIDGCDKRQYSRSMCRNHHARVIRGTMQAPAESLSLWRGTPTYAGVHDRIRARRGSARLHPCSHSCGRQALQWAYDYSDPDPLHRDVTGAPYSTDIHRYLPLCASCHKRFDLGRKAG